MRILTRLLIFTFWSILRPFFKLEHLNLVQLEHLIHWLTWILGIVILTLKRPRLCGWLRPTQFKPRLDWVGSAAQVRRYCVDSAAQAFIHALAGCVQHSLQHALCGPRNSRSVHFAIHALDVHATHESPNLTQLSGRVKNVYRHLLRFLTLMFSNKVKTNQNIFHLLFLGPC